jgi:putative thioredoxin
MAAKSRHTIDVTDATFEALVVAESRTRPVVVDFWAPWCGPCRALGPILERLAEEGGGKWRLAKVNTDVSPRVSSDFGIQGIPAVMAFQDGRVVADFVGAMPEGRVRAWLDGFLPGEAEALVAKADAARVAGRLDDAELDYERALDLKPRLWSALLGLAHIAASKGDELAVERQLGLVRADDEARAAPHVAAIRFSLRTRGGVTEEAARAQVAADPADLGARLDLGLALAAAGKTRDALEALLEVVARDRGDLRARAREAMVMLFDVAGSRSPLSEEYRARLSRELFK